MPIKNYLFAQRKRYTLLTGETNIFTFALKHKHYHFSKLT